MARKKSTPDQQPANRAGQRHIAGSAGWVPCLDSLRKVLEQSGLRNGVAASAEEQQEVQRGLSAIQQGLGGAALFLLSHFVGADNMPSTSVPAFTAAAAPASAPKTRNALAETAPAESPLVSHVAIPGAQVGVSISADSTILRLSAQLGKKGTTANAVPVLRTNDGAYVIYNAALKSWDPLTTQNVLPRGFTINASSPSDLQIPFADLSGNPKNNGAQIMLAYGNTVTEVVKNNAYGVVEVVVPKENTRYLDASVPVAPGEIATTPTPIKFNKAGKVLEAFGCKYQITTADGKAGEWIDQPGDVPAGAKVNMQITTSAEVGVNNAGSLLTQEDGGETIKNTFQVPTELETLYTEDDLSRWLDGSTILNNLAIDTPLKIDVPGITDVTLKKKKTGEVVSFTGTISSPTKGYVRYELLYKYVSSGEKKIVDFDTTPPLSVLTKEVVMESCQTSKEFQLNVSSITMYCKTVDCIAYMFKVGADHILSSKDGVVVTLKGYDATKGVIAITIDTSAATIMGNQDVSLKTVNDSAAGKERNFTLTIRNIGQKAATTQK